MSENSEKIDITISQRLQTACFIRATADIQFNNDIKLRKAANPSERRQLGEAFVFSYQYY